MRRTIGRRCRAAAVVFGMASLVLIVGPAAAQEGAEVASRPTGETGGEAHPLAPALEQALAAHAALKDVKDYEATFSKRELVNGQMVPLTMQVKFREEPFSVYLRFQKAHEGREVIYVAGRNGGKLLAHETGLKSIVGTVALDPESPHAMSEGRYPITLFGMKNLVEGIIGQWRVEQKYGEVDVKYYPKAKLGAMECLVIESSHPRPRRQFRTQMTRLYIDKASRLPVRVEQYAFSRQPGGEPVLIEEYTYSNIRTNVGLTDRDFDPRNPQYGF